jgi:mitochondrial fission protein ELM1
VARGPLGDEVWLLAGNRPGELAQQRALGAALGLPVREIAVARMAPTGREVSYDFNALRPPWPRVAISFGKTLAAGLRLRELGGSAVRLVHLGLPRRVAAAALDLIVPMPTDRYIDAPNVFRPRMPFNPLPPLPADSPAAQRLRAADLPRPWTALIVGGPTRRLRLEPKAVARIAADADARARAYGGSLLVSTSPRTPAEAVTILQRARTAPGELFVFAPASAGDNPYAAYLHLADELIVTGDSASMIAECWRSGRPLWVAPLGLSPSRRLARRLRSAVPARLIASGRIAGDVDIGRWIDVLARAGEVGLLGVSDPSRPYRSEDDDDMRQVVLRICELLAQRPDAV